MDALTDDISEINSSLNAIVNEIKDNGWEDVPLTTNTTPEVDSPPIMRKIGNKLIFNGRFTIADIKQGVFLLPDNYKPAKIQMKNVPLNDTHGLYAVLAFLTDGNVMLYLPSSLTFSTSLNFRCDTEIILD